MTTVPGMRDVIRAISPRWARRKWGERFLYTPAVIADQLLEAAVQGVRARFPDFGPEDALGPMARDRVLRRGFAEPQETFRLRLRRWLDDARVGGSAWGILEQVRAYLYPYQVRLRFVNVHGDWHTIEADGTRSLLREGGNWIWDGAPSTSWARAWLIIYPSSSGLWANDGTWDDAGTWDDGGTWDTTATIEQVASIREILRDPVRGRPAGTSVPWVVVSFDDAAFDPLGGGAGYPAGTWEFWGADDGFGVCRPARNEVASYWDGTAGELSVLGGG